MMICFVKFRLSYSVLFVFCSTCTMSS